LNKCAAAGQEYCDACKKLRNASTLHCVHECPVNTTQYNGYCVDSLIYPTSSSDGKALLKLTLLVCGGVILFVLIVFPVLRAMVYAIKKRKTSKQYGFVPFAGDDL